MTLRAWLIQFFGVILLLLLVWGLLNTPDQRAWQVEVSGVLALISLGFAAWLILLNFAGQPTPLGRIPLVFACLALLLLLLFLAGYLENYRWQISNWLASALTMQRKKPVTPEAISKAFTWAMVFLRWILLPLLIAPLAIRAAGSGWPRFGRLAPTWLILFLLGAVVPHTIVYWVPALSGFWPRILSAALRFLFAYALMITAWTYLGHAARSLEARR
jgi:hypothetical protein